MRLRIGAVCAVAASLTASMACSGPDLGGARRFDTRASQASPNDPASPAPSPAPASTDANANTDAAAPAPDACAGRRVCDSFESYDDGAAPAGPWKVSTAQGGAVAISTARAHSGSRSVKVTTGPSVYQRAMLATDGAPLFPLAKGALYGRMMVWLEQPAADGVHWTMLSGEGPLPGRPGVTGFYRYGGQLAGKLLANYDTAGASTDCWQHSATTMPIGKWTCVAWRLDGVANAMELSMDGRSIADLHVASTGQGCLGHDLADEWVGPDFASATVGWESYQADVGHTMYIDDVVLDDAPIACP
jgi:hypothetical protein